MSPQYASELMPTVLRGRGVALCEVFGGVAILLSPVIVHLVSAGDSKEIVLQTINRRSCTITVKATTRALSWLKAATTTFPLKTLC